MADKLIYYIEDRFIKSVVLKKLHEKNLEFIEVLDDRDLYLKLDIFKETILFFIIQIKEGSLKEQYKMIKNIKKTPEFLNLPVIALIPYDTVEFVSGAAQAGIEDVILIPEKREMFREFFSNRFDEFLRKIPKGKEVHPDIDEIRKSILSTLASNQEVNKEIKRAGRGKYSISFVMGRITGVHIGMIQEFYDKLKNEMRETDQVINNDYRTFIVVCPFTQKKYTIEVEKKIRRAFEEMFGGYTKFRRLDMYGATYPEDGRSMDKLLEIMGKGVNDSIIISSIHEPLNKLSRERLEEYKNMLKLYK